MKYQVQAILSSAEQFFCKLYDPKTTNTLIHEVRCALFRKVKANVDTLPPTQDALSLHLMRAHYQTKVWKQSLVTHPQLPLPTSCGWHMKDGMLVPQLLTKEPVQCLELTICGCERKLKSVQYQAVSMQMKWNILQWGMWVCLCSLVQEYSGTQIIIIWHNCFSCFVD